MLNVEILSVKAGLDKEEDERLARRDALQRQQIEITAELRKLEKP